MSAHPLATFAQMRQRPDAGPVLPPRKPGRHRRSRLRPSLRLRFPYRLPHRSPVSDAPGAPVGLTPADLRP